MLHLGPQSFSPLSEKTRFLINCPMVVEKKTPDSKGLYHSMASYFVEFNTMIDLLKLREDAVAVRHTPSSIRWFGSVVHISFTLLPTFDGASFLTRWLVS